MAEERRKTYMQEVAVYEFDYFDEATELFYEMIDSFHRMGDQGFLQNMINDYGELFDSEIYEKVRSPESIIPVIGKISKMNEKIDELKDSMLDILTILDEMRVTDPQKRRKRIQESEWYKNMDILPMLVNLNARLKERIEEREPQEEDIVYDPEINKIRERISKIDM